MLLSVACLALPFPPTLSHKRQEFGEKIIIQKVCFFFYYVSLKHFSNLEESAEILSQMHTDLHLKFPSLLPHFNKTCIFWADFRKILEYQIV